MKKMPSPRVRFNLVGIRSLIAGFALLFTAFLIGKGSSVEIEAIPTNSEAEKLGLVIHWRTQIERTPFGTGRTGIVLWPHSTQRRESVTVKIGNRVAERIDANQLNVESAEKLVSSGKSIPKLPRLGMDAARERAKKLVKQYEILGKKPVIEEYSQPVSYLVSASDDGAVQAFDSETGEVLWATSVGDYRLPTFGPGVNDDYVAVANGNNLYVLDLMTGKIINQRKLKESVVASPQPIDQLIYAPGIDGSITWYQANDPLVEPRSHRFTGTMTAPIVVSPDRSYLAWPHKNYVYVAQSGPGGNLWSRLQSSSIFKAAPQATSDGFIAVSVDGVIFKINLSKMETIMWRENTALPVSKPPLVVDGLVTVVSDDGTLLAINEANGQFLWEATVLDVARVLSITKNCVYAQRKAGQLVTIDRKTGKTLANVTGSFAHGFHNTVNDRILLFSQSGALICLREPESTFPVLNNPPVQSGSGAAKKKSKKPANNIETPAAEDANDSPFGENMNDGPAKPATVDSTDDPFGADAPSMTEDDPFGS